MFGISVDSIIQSGGILLVAGIIFAETGLLAGFFLPGDTLLFTAGFFAAQGKLPLGWLLLAVVAAAAIGDNLGYTIGKHGGPRVFKKEDGILFREEYVERSEAFYKKHGGKTVMFARFVPIVRTFSPVVAGVGHMPRKKFVIFSLIGSLCWAGGVTMLGSWLGSKIPNIDHYLLPVIGLAVFISTAPTVWHIVGDAETRQKIMQKFKRS